MWSVSKSDLAKYLYLVITQNAAKFLQKVHKVKLHMVLVEHKSGVRTIL